MFKPRIWRSRVFRKHVEYLLGLIAAPTDACVTWPFYRTKDGYGKTTRWIGAHRLACYLAHGEPPAEKLVAAHNCGKGHLGCVNPNHLRWATQTENMADKWLHGTQHSNLTEAQASALKTEFIANPLTTNSALAARYGVDVQTVRNLLRGKTYRHVGPVVTLSDLDKHKYAEQRVKNTEGHKRVLIYGPGRPRPVDRRPSRAPTRVQPRDRP